MPSTFASLVTLSALASGQLLNDIPEGFNQSQWALYSNENPLLAVIPGNFNRTVFDAPSDANTTDDRVTAINEQLNTTSFVAYEDRFFDLLGPDVSIELVQTLTFQVHEAACYIPEQGKLFFVEWGPPGGEDEVGTHDWQYMLDVKTNELSKIQTNPPTANVHGCVYQNGKLNVVTDGSTGLDFNETAYLAQIDPETLERTTILNNYYERPFMGLNDLEMDAEGNYYITDSKSGFGRGFVTYTPPTEPTIYFVNGTTLRAKELWVLEGNANGISLSPDGSSLYIGNTGASGLEGKDPHGRREMQAFDFARSASGARLPLLTNRRMLSNAIQYFYDGFRVSCNGWIFAAGGDGLSVLDPESGMTLGVIRVGGGDFGAVTVALHEHELWILGKGGLWHVKNIAEKLT